MITKGIILSFLAVGLGFGAASLVFSSMASTDDSVPLIIIIALGILEIIHSIWVSALREAHDGKR